MSDGYCKKHFISYCPELSKDCPYCEVERLRAELQRVLGKKLIEELADDTEARLNRLLERLNGTERLSHYGVRADTTDDDSCRWINAELIDAAIAEARGE